MPFYGAPCGARGPERLAEIHLQVNHFRTAWKKQQKCR